MNAPLAHSPFGGSVAARVLRCPASVTLAAKVPAYLRKPSAYAARGSALHIAATLLIDEKETLETIAGKTIGAYKVTADDIENSLRPAFAYITELLDTDDAAFYAERRVVFPTIPGAFGTSDLIVRIGSTIHVVDYKFGAGMLVRALSPADDDPNADVLNAQLLFYAAAARHSLPAFFAGVDTIVLTIVQPQSIEPDAEMVSSATIAHHEIDEFEVAFGSVCAEALSDAPRLRRGEWCRFCPAIPICPEHTKPLLDLAQFAAPTLHDTLQAVVSAPAREAYLTALARGLDLVDTVKNLRTALHDQAKAALENGDTVPGYKLSAGRAERRWRDDINAVCTALWHLGLDRKDVFAEEMRSPKQVETRAKARGLKVPQELIVSRRSGTSLVRAENARFPILGEEESVRLFSEALKALGGGRP
jgi:hypothetical protein